MNINIVTYDVSKIHDAIFKYNALHFSNPYIICSNDTKNLIASISNPENFYHFVDKNQSAINTYLGCKMLEDNSLKLGKVEVR